MKKAIIAVIIIAILFSTGVYHCCAEDYSLSVITEKPYIVIELSPANLFEWKCFSSDDIISHIFDIAFPRVSDFDKGFLSCIGKRLVYLDSGYFDTNVMDGLGNNIYSDFTKYSFVHRFIPSIKFDIYVSSDHRKVYITNIDLNRIFSNLNQFSVSLQEAVAISEKLYTTIVNEMNKDAMAFVSTYGSKYISFESLSIVVSYENFEKSDKNPYWQIDLYQMLSGYITSPDGQECVFMNPWLSIEIDAKSGEIVYYNDSNLFTINNYPFGYTVIDR